MTDTNDDFEHAVDAAAMSEAERYATRDVVDQYRTVRDQKLKDYLNTNVVRRIRTANAKGVAHVHAGTAWQLVQPSIQIPSFVKAQSQTVFGVELAWLGQATSIAANIVLSFGVRLTDTNGTTTNYEIMSADAGTGGYGITITWAGMAELVNVPAGTWKLDGIVKGNIAAAGWATTANSSLSMSCWEVAAP
jgi:hypothetical protein